MKNLFRFLIALIVFSSCTEKEKIAVYSPVWITTGDKARLLSVDSVLMGSKVDSITTINLDTAKVFQPIDGFGYALTGGSAYLINQKLSAQQRKDLLEELFTDKGIRINYLRVSVGSSDLDAYPFTYNDLPKGKTDKR